MDGKASPTPAAAPVATDLSNEDCEVGLNPIPSAYGDTLGCGTMLKSSAGKWIGGADVGREKAGLLQVGSNVYRVALEKVGFVGANFKVRMTSGPVVEDCFDAAGVRIPECESTTTEVTVVLECNGKKRTYEKWKKIEGC